MLDVRLPIGWLFIVLGVMLAGYGYVHPPAESFNFGTLSLPLNLNVPWGILMAIFGLIMVSLAKLDSVLIAEKEALASVEAGQ
jgi:hypothetical protein